MWLYSLLLALIFLVPLILSFESKLQFYRQWKSVIPSILLVATFYLVCDVYLTKKGIWGFNPRYHSNVLLYGLPLEEWLFFIVVPYASIFIHETLDLYFPNFQLSYRASVTLSVVLIAILSITAILNFNKTYTVYIFTVSIAAVLLSFIDVSRVLRKYYLSFLVILIPFIIINSILTGTCIEEEVVWYNNNEILGLRVLTIPIEDFGYVFSLILFNLLLIAVFKNRMRNTAL